MFDGLGVLFGFMLSAEALRWWVFGAIVVVLVVLIWHIFTAGLGINTFFSRVDIEKAIENSDSLSEIVQKAYYGSWIALSCKAVPNQKDEMEQKIRNDIKQIADFEKCTPDVFITDAIFQYGMSYFERNFVEPYEALVNIFPPLGFLGTILGMTVIFMASDGDLDKGIKSVGMGTALQTTVLALCLFVIFELLKIYLFRRGEKCVRLSIVNAQELLAASEQKKKKKQLKSSRSHGLKNRR